MSNRAIPACYPVFYQGASLAELIQYIIDHHTPPTTIVVCTERQVFVDQLLSSVQQTSRVNDDIVPTDQDTELTADYRARRTTPSLLQRTLRLLATSRTIKVAFPTSVPALHAYLSTQSQPHVPASTSGDIRGCPSPPVLALIGVISLHKEAGSYSAQGLGRAFAAAVEAAWHSRRRLIVAEFKEDKATETSEGEPVAEDVSREIDGDVDMTSNGHEEERIIHTEMRDDVERHDDSNPWDQDVPILSATTKTFGNSVEKGWMERTVKVADVAKQWMRFEELPHREA